LRNSVKVAIAAVVAVASLGGLIAIVVHARQDENTTGHLSFARTEPAAAPFAEFMEARVALGKHCLRVLVASTETQRQQGLRDITKLAPYDGMLFVFPGNNAAQFTMAETPMPLDIAFFDAHGNPVSHRTMTPCPRGTDATCPVYSSDHKYRLALETPAGSQSAGGSIGPCAA
jgi:uncharacterized membrane protein (UPF0127 family)